MLKLVVLLIVIVSISHAKIRSKHSYGVYSGYPRGMASMSRRYDPGYSSMVRPSYLYSGRDDYLDNDYFDRRDYGDRDYDYTRYMGSSYMPFRSYGYGDLDSDDYSYMGPGSYSTLNGRLGGMTVGGTRLSSMPLSGYTYNYRNGDDYSPFSSDDHISMTYGSRYLYPSGGRSFSYTGPMLNNGFPPSSVSGYSPRSYTYGGLSGRGYLNSGSIRGSGYLTYGPRSYNYLYPTGSYSVRSYTYPTSSVRYTYPSRLTGGMTGYSTTGGYHW